MALPRYAAGDLVITRFTVPGRVPASLNVALVLVSWPWGSHSTHHLLCLIDTDPSTDPYAIPLDPADVITAVIPQRVFIRPTYLHTVGASSIRSRGGKVKPDKLQEAVDRLADTLYEDLEDGADRGRA